MLAFAQFLCNGRADALFIPAAAIQCDLTAVCCVLWRGVAWPSGAACTKYVTRRVNLLTDCLRAVDWTPPSLPPLHERIQVLPSPPLPLSPLLAQAAPPRAAGVGFAAE